MSAVNTGTPSAAASTSPRPSDTGATDAWEARSEASGSSGATAYSATAPSRPYPGCTYSTRTRVPGASRSPSSTTPTPSSPITYGGRGGPSKKWPFQMCSSTGLSAAAWIRTSASPGPRRGTGTSAGAGGRPASSIRAARTLEAYRIAGGYPAVARHRLARVGVEAGVAVRLVVALERERAADGVVRLARDHEV